MDLPEVANWPTILDLRPERKTGREKESGQFVLATIKNLYSASALAQGLQTAK
jgi:hypothetical protein